MDGSSDDTTMPSSKGSMALEPISIPAASERVTTGFEIGVGSVEDVALLLLSLSGLVEGVALLLLLVPISIPAASERVTAGFEIWYGSVEVVELEVAFGVVPISIPPTGGFASAVVAWDI